MNKLSDQEILKLLQDWQSCDYVHQLTCGGVNCNEVLEPTTETIDYGRAHPGKKHFKEKQVILKCPKCNYKQYHYPDCVLYLNCKALNIL